MKLRQKLAAVLAASMVVTAVPVTTMAATATLSNTVSAVEGTELGYTTSGTSIVLQNSKVDLVIALTDLDKTLAGTNRATFYVQSDNADFNEDAINAATFTGATVTFLDDDEIKVVITEATADYVSIPLYVEIGEGEPKIIVDGAESFVESKTLSITGAEVSDKALTAKASKTTIPVTGGKIGKITITEVVAETLTEDQEITIELPDNSDVVFKNTTSVTLKGYRGLSTIATTATASLSTDDKTLTVTLPAVTGATLKGYVEISGIEVVADEKREDLDVQTIEVTVDGDNIAETDLEVAEVKEEGVTLTVKEEKELLAGKGTKKVTVTLKEAAPDSIDARHDLYFSVDKAEVVSAKVITDDTKKVTAAINDLDDDEFYVALTGKSTTEVATIVLELELRADADATGDVVLTAESRSLDTVEVTVAEVVAAVTVEATPVVIEPGVSKQVGGSITIKEAEKGSIEKGFLVLSIDSRYGVYFTDKKVKIETTGGLEVKADSLKEEDQMLVLEVTRTSKEAGEITISGFSFDADRTVPTGEMKLEIGGDALAEANVYDKTDLEKAFEDTIEVKDFIEVEVAGAKEEAVEASFTMSANTYLVNGETKVMDVAPYVSAEGRTMVPVKYLAAALGLPEEALTFNVVDGKGVVTLITDTKVITLVNGEKSLTVNGATVPMTSAVTIKDGRTFTPVTEIAAVLGMSANWDAATQTATFSK